ncbi:coiled-coil domain-containing protein 34 isoform X1 [Arapaima gigas]
MYYFVFRTTLPGATLQNDDKSGDSYWTSLRNREENKELSRSGSEDDESTGESTSSLLSPIYHNSFESDPEDGEYPEEPASQGVPWSQGGKEMTIQGETDVKNSSGLTLSAWEEWIISKARKDRLRMERKAREEAVLRETKMQQEKEQEQRKIAVEKKISEWLQTKRNQEKMEKQLKNSIALEEENYKRQKKRESEEKAQKRYMEWLQKKKQEAMMKNQKEKEEAARRDLEARERKQRSDEEFKKWLMNVKDRPQPVTNTSSSRRNMKGYYDNAYPAPSYCNPIPWKPIHNPAPQDMQKNTSRRNRAQR